MFMLRTELVKYFLRKSNAILYLSVYDLTPFIEARVQRRVTSITYVTYCPPSYEKAFDKNIISYLRILKKYFSVLN